MCKPSYYRNNQFDSFSSPDTIQLAAGIGEPIKGRIHGQTDISQDRDDDPGGGVPGTTADGARRRGGWRNEMADIHAVSAARRLGGILHQCDSVANCPSKRPLSC